MEINGDSVQDNDHTDPHYGMLLVSFYGEGELYDVFIDFHRLYSQILGLKKEQDDDGNEGEGKVCAGLK